jgi:small-conductance mechanosensitive channel
MTATISHVLIDQLLTPVLIVIGAALVSRVARYVVKHTVRRFGSREMQRRMTVVRRHAPAAFFKTDETLTLRSAQRVEAIAAAGGGAVSFVIWIVAAVLILHSFGAQIGPILAGAGLLGVALGFGAQSLVRDLVSGFFILVEDQFGVGDWVTVGKPNGVQASGEVEAVTLRATRIRAVDGTVWHVPNGQMTPVGNMSQHWSRALVDVRVAYATDVEQARRAMKEAADEVWRGHDAIIEEPEVWGVVSMDHTGILIRLVAKTEPLQQWRMSRLLREKVKARFDEEGIEIPSVPVAVPDTASAGGADAVSQVTPHP